MREMISVGLGMWTGMSPLSGRSLLLDGAGWRAGELEGQGSGSMEDEEDTGGEAGPMGTLKEEEEPERELENTGFERDGSGKGGARLNHGRKSRSVERRL